MLPTESRALDWMAPSGLERLRCPARVAFVQRAGPEAKAHQGAPTPAALLGTIVHGSLERVALGEAVEEAWNDACEEHAPDDEAAGLPSYRRTWLRYRRKAEELVGYLADRPEVEPIPEAELRSADGVLRGTADLVLRSETSLSIVDYKTGFVREEEAPKSSYERQLQIYAALARETYDLPVSEAQLMSLREGSVVVDVDDSVITAVVADARRRLEEFNARTPGAQPAEPSVESCRWCRFSSACDGFWSAVDQSWTEAVGVCVRGEVAEVEVAANGMGSVLLTPSFSNVEVEASLLVSELSASDVENVDRGVEIAVTGLRWHPRNDRALLRTSRTTLHLS